MSTTTSVSASTPHSSRPRQSQTPSHPQQHQQQQHHQQHFQPDEQTQSTQNKPFRRLSNLRSYTSNHHARQQQPPPRQRPTLASRFACFSLPSNPSVPAVLATPDLHPYRPPSRTANTNTTNSTNSTTTSTHNNHNHNNTSLIPEVNEQPDRAASASPTTGTRGAAPLEPLSLHPAGQTGNNHSSAAPAGSADSPARRPSNAPPSRRSASPSNPSSQPPSRGKSRASDSAGVERPSSSAHRDPKPRKVQYCNQETQTLEAPAPGPSAHTQATQATQATQTLEEREPEQHEGPIPEAIEEGDTQQPEAQEEDPEDPDHQDPEAADGSNAEGEAEPHESPDQDQDHGHDQEDHESEGEDDDNPDIMPGPRGSSRAAESQSAVDNSNPANSTELNSRIPEEGAADRSTASPRPKQKATIRFFPYQDSNQHSRPSLPFIPISRTLPNESSIIRVGRYSERDGLPVANPMTPSEAPVGFKSKVVSRKHCEFLFSNGQWHVKDVGSSSGTFLNHMRLSQPNTASRLYTVKDGDIVQLGIDFRGGEEMIFRCVRIRVECNRSWQQRPNEFNKNTETLIKNLGKGDAADYSGCRECSICLGSVLRPYQCLFMAACAHVWHYKCVSRLIHTPDYPMFQCPNCRAYTDLSADVDDAGSVEEEPEENKVASNENASSPEEPEQVEQPSADTPTPAAAPAETDRGLEPNPTAVDANRAPEENDNAPEHVDDAHDAAPDHHEHNPEETAAETAAETAQAAVDAEPSAAEPDAAPAETPETERAAEAEDAPAPTSQTPEEAEEVEEASSSDRASMETDRDPEEVNNPTSESGRPVEDTADRESSEAAPAAETGRESAATQHAPEETDAAPAETEEADDGSAKTSRASVESDNSSTETQHAPAKANHTPETESDQPEPESRLHAAATVDLASARSSRTSQAYYESNFMPEEAGLAVNIEHMHLHDSDDAQEFLDGHLDRATSVKKDKKPIADLHDVREVSGVSTPSIAQWRQDRLRADTPTRSDDESALTPQNDSGPLAFDGRARMS